MRIPEELEALKQQPQSEYRLPMSRDQPDCVFADEENGVVASKHGDDIFYASLYWRARTGINFLARVHYINSDFECLSTVMQEVEFTPQRKNYIRPNRSIFGFGDGDPISPFVRESVHTGERNPIAKILKDVDFNPRRESIYSGKGEFYVLHYGKYVIPFLK